MEKARIVDSYGGVTAALKRAFTLQTTVKERSVQVVIEGDSNGRAKCFLEADCNR